MEKSSELCLHTTEDSEQFFRRATSWYFGGYLKMDTNKAPDPVDLITFLRVLGFRESSKDLPANRSPRKKNGYRIEISCDNPGINVRMEYPEIKSSAMNDNSRERTFPLASDISVRKMKVVKEVFSMLMEFLWEKDGSIQRKSKILEQPQWRRCMSMSAMGTPTPQISLPLNKTDQFSNGQKSCRVVNVEEVVMDSGGDGNNKGMRKQEEAMEVDMPSLNSSSLPSANLSPIGLARQRTWTLETSKSEDKEFEEARTSTPNKSHQSGKIGLNPAHGLSKILRPRQARTEVQPQRLRSANTESLRMMTQMRDAKNLSSRRSNNSKNSSVSSSSSISSYTSVDTTGSNSYRNTSSRLLAPPFRTNSTTGGAKPKLQSHSEAIQHSPLNSNLRTPAAVTRTRRLVSLPQVKEDSRKMRSNNSMKKGEPPSLKKLDQEISADEEKRSVRKRPSLLPRFRAAQKNPPPSKG